MPRHPDPPRRVVYDTATGRVGEVMDVTRAERSGVPIGVYLRPVGGGYEWRAEPADLRAVEEHQPNTRPNDTNPKG